MARRKRKNEQTTIYKHYTENKRLSKASSTKTEGELRAPER